MIRIRHVRFSGEEEIACPCPDSNREPTDYESAALTIELQGHMDLISAELIILVRVCGRKDAWVECVKPVENAQIESASFVLRFRKIKRTERRIRTRLPTPEMTANLRLFLAESSNLAAS